MHAPPLASTISRYTGQSHRHARKPSFPVTLSAALTTAVLLSIVQVVVDTPRMLLLDRFIPGGGWLEIVLLAVYTGFVARNLSAVRNVRTWRPRVWRLFSVVFFAQLLIGLAGVERFLMTGELHLPIPALIVAGPVYRGGGLFMLLLFLSTILLAGPAWCSHLCYIGAWDDLAARARKLPRPLPRWREPVRVGLLIAVVATALALRLAGVATPVAAGAALAFGLAGAAIMATWSRKAGVMAHCTTWCPIGLVADVLGKLSPFRLRIGPGCERCGACANLCRYDALSEEHLRRGRPGLTCTLCGDCLAACPTGAIGYRFPGLSPGRARAVFLVVVVSLHAVFLGVARL